MEATFKPLSDQQLDGLLGASKQFAAEDLAEQWLPLAMKLASKQWKRVGGDLAEWQSLARYALWRAARTFRARLGYAFGSYLGVAVERVFGKERALPTTDMLDGVAVEDVHAEFTPEMERAWATLTPIQQYVVERTVLCGCELVELAGDLTATRIGQIRDEGLRKLRAALEHPEWLSQGELWEQAG